MFVTPLPYQTGLLLSVIVVIGLGVHGCVFSFGEVVVVGGVLGVYSQRRQTLMFYRKGYPTTIN